MSWLLRSGGLFSCRWFFRGRGLRRRFRLRFPAPAGARIVEFWRALAGCGFSAPQLSRGVVLRDGLVGFSGFCFRRFRRSSFVCVHGPSAVGSSVRVSADPLLVDFGHGLPTRLPGRHLLGPALRGGRVWVTGRGRCGCVARFGFVCGQASPAGQSGLGCAPLSRFCCRRCSRGPGWSFFRSRARRRVFFGAGVPCAGLFL